MLAVELRARVAMAQWSPGVRQQLHRCRQRNGGPVSEGQDSSILSGVDIKGATADRLYEQYALTTKDLTWEPTYGTKEEIERSEFATAVHFRDWDTFEDPFRLHYADYVRVQAEKESIMAEQRKLAARFKEVDGI